MKKIKLTQGKFAIVDEQDYPLLVSRKWFAVHDKNRRWYAATKIGKKTVKMHRFILDCAEMVLTDHINRDGLDNCRRNLRECNFSQNMANSIKREKTSSKFKGVGLDKDTGKWRARIRVNGDEIHLGRFNDESKAAAAYNAAALRVFGEFANLNVI